MIGIDTNVLLRIFVDDQNRPQVEAARRLVSEPGGENIRIAIIVLAEAMWTLRRRYGVKKVGLLRFLVDLLDHPRFDVESRDAVEDALEDYRFWKVEFADCLIAALNKQAGARTTLTFDRHASARPPFSLLKIEA